MGVPQEVSTNLVDESYFRLAFGVFWVISFLVRTYFQARTGRSQHSFTRNEKAAKRGFPILAMANWIVGLIYPSTVAFMYLTRVSAEEEMI